MRTTLLIFISLILAGAIATPRSAHAVRDRGVTPQLFTPALNAEGVLNAEAPWKTQRFTLDFVMGSNWSMAPLRLDFSGAANSAERDALRYQTAFDFGFSLGVFNHFQFSMLVPLYQQGLGDTFSYSREWGFTYNDAFNSFSAKPPKSIPGDPRAALKFMFFNTGSFSAALQIGVTLPFGTEEVFGGDSSLSYIPSLLLGYRNDRFRIIANLHYVHRDKKAIYDPLESDRLLIESSPEVQGTVALRIGLARWVALTVGTSAYKYLDSETETRPVLEFTAGFLFRASREISFSIFGGSGATLNDEFGRGTNLRAGGYLVWQPGRVKTAALGKDTDGDGIPDAVDDCPDKKEDRDNFEDNDGCPDPDNDLDGIPDKLDKCPTEPEDEDDFQDSDGCPDTDNDGDGVIDSIDSCPGKDSDVSNGFKNTKEDKDNFEDEDGCPDRDNDGDGINDDDDKCPNQKEIFNGLDDTDGCPDSGHGAEIKESRIILAGKVRFKKGTAIISKRSYAMLLKLANLLKLNSAIRLVRIEGHTDKSGSERKNIFLSTARAIAVKNYLISKGVSAFRLQSVGYGSRFPLKRGTSAKNREANRRVEFIIVYK